MAVRKELERCAGPGHKRPCQLHEEFGLYSKYKGMPLGSFKPGGI